MSKIQVLDFDNLTPDQVTFLNQTAEDIKKIEKGIIEGFIEIGAKLSHIQQAIPGGLFKSWIEQEFQWSRSTAYKYIKIHQELDELVQNSGQPLPVSLEAVHELARYIGGQPEDKEQRFTQVIEQTKKKGNRLTAKEIKKLINEGNDETPSKTTAKTKNKNQAVTKENNTVNAFNSILQAIESSYSVIQEQYSCLNFTDLTPEEESLILEQTQKFEKLCGDQGLKISNILTKLSKIDRTMEI